MMKLYKFTTAKTLLFLLISLVFVSAANAAPYVYVTNLCYGTATQIDTDDGTVIGKVNTGTIYPYGAAISPDGKLLYVTTFNPSGTVHIIDLGSNTVSGTINVGPYPCAVAIAPDGKKAYVTNFYGTNPNVLNDGTLTVVDLTTRTVTKTMDAGTDPYGVAFTPDGKKAYVTNYNPISGQKGSITVFDAVNDTFVERITTSPYQYGIVISPDGTKAYIADRYPSVAASGTLTIFDLASKTFIGSIPDIGLAPDGIAISPDGKEIYVTNHNPDGGEGTITVVDLVSNSIARRINAGRHPTGIAVAPEIIAVQPVADFTLPASNLYSSAQLLFTETSTDASGCLHTWDFGDGSTQSGTEEEMNSVVHAYAGPGTYTVTLTLSDDGGKTLSSKTRTLAISPKPTLNITAEPMIAVATLTSVRFTDGSTDMPEGASYLWDFGDGQTDRVIGSTSHIYDVAGTYPATLTITDRDGVVLDTETIYITVEPSRAVAFFAASRHGGQSGQSITFDAGASSEADGCEYWWNFGDNGESYVKGGSVVSHTYFYQEGYSDSSVNANAAHYTVTLKLVRHGIEVSRFTLPGTINIADK